VPLNSEVDFDETKDFALALGQLLEREHPKLVTTNMNKAERPGKVFIDWSQNTCFKTTVAVYSLRARERPTVSTPVTWDEIERASQADDLRFESADVLERVAEHGDLFEPLVTLRQDLPAFG
jgi:bifunctional non-homologous end joining protein LigD